MFADTLAAARDRIVAQIMEIIAETPVPQGGLVASVDDTRQFVVGFVHAAIEAAKGNEEPREQYMSLVVPSVKQAGMPMSIVMAGMLQVSLGGAVALEGAGRKQWIAFCTDHMHRLCGAWEAA